MALLTSIALLFTLYYTPWVVYARTLHPLSKYSGPFLASISRVWIGWRVWKGDAHIIERQLYQKYGKFVRIAPNEVFISDPAAVRTIYGVNSGFTKTDFYLPWRANFFRLPGNFTQTDEKVHAERRRIVNSMYSMSSVVQSEQYIETCVREFMSKIERLANENNELNLFKWLQWYAFDVIGELYFSRMFGFMEKEEDHGRWISSLDTLLPVLAVGSVMPTYVRTLVLIGSLAIPGTSSALKAMQTIANASETCVTARLEHLKQGNKIRNDILQRMMEINREKGSKIDFQMVDVQVEVYVGLFAGSDTTMAALSSVFYHLLKAPSALSKLRQELDEATEGGQLSEMIKYSEASRLFYLGACIKEGLRLHPSVGLTVPRHVPKGGGNICGEDFPWGVRVGVSAAVIHHDESYFGRNASSYEPGRWLHEGAETMGRYFFAFGSGARTCIGKNVRVGSWAPPHQAYHYDLLT